MQNLSLLPRAEQAHLRRLRRDLTLATAQGPGTGGGGKEREAKPKWYWTEVNQCWDERKGEYRAT